MDHKMTNLNTRLVGTSQDAHKERRDLSSCIGPGWGHQAQATAGSLPFSFENWAHFMEIQQDKVLWRRNMVFGIRKNYWSWGWVRGNHVSTFLSLSPSFPLSLKINKIFFKIVKKKEGIFLSRNLESFLKIKLDLTFKWNLINKTSKQNRARNIKIKNKLTVTRGEVGGDSGRTRGKGFQEQL